MLMNPILVVIAGKVAVTKLQRKAVPARRIILVVPVMIRYPVFVPAAAENNRTIPGRFKPEIFGDPIAPALTGRPVKGYMLVVR